MFGTLVTDFHRGSSMMVTPDVTDYEIWFPVTNKKLDKIRVKKQIDNYNDKHNNNMQNNKPDDASNGEPLLHSSAHRCQLCQAPPRFVSDPESSCIEEAH